ncbi:MAG TPA: hypothetical protein VMV49_15550 [Candidatus Deferrimicrobium sp.]|nr:hypothetical protein [Candidatus Deferrimicrobium sp.]
MGRSSPPGDTSRQGSSSSSGTSQLRSGPPPSGVAVVGGSTLWRSPLMGAASRWVEGCLCGSRSTAIKPYNGITVWMSPFPLSGLRRMVAILRPAAATGKSASSTGMITLPAGAIVPQLLVWHSQRMGEPSRQFRASMLNALIGPPRRPLGLRI